MIRDDDVRRIINQPGSDHRTFNILCRVPVLERMITNSLESSGFRQDPEATTLLLVDAPQGFALRQLEQPDRTGLCVIVTTSSTTPEYLEDIWDLQPAILLVGDHLHGEVENAIQRARNGERYRIVPDIPTVLTPCERVALRYVARGWTPERIATHRGVSAKTIGNALAIICEKLQMPSRQAAMLYYWGHLDLLD